MRCQPLIRCAKHVVLAALVTAGLPATATLAAGDHNALRARIGNFLRAKNAGVAGRVTVDVTMPRVHMSLCHAPQPFLPGRGTRRAGRLTVGVRCPGDRPATRYFQADVHIHAYYYVAAHNIAPGQTIARADIRRSKGDITRMSGGVVTQPGKLLGKIAVRRIGSAMPMRADMVAAPKLVKRGASVAVIAQGPGFSITTHGEALNSAPSGGRVRVHTDSGTIVTGTPRDAYTVVIQP